MAGLIGAEVTYRPLYEKDWRVGTIVAVKERRLVIPPEEPPQLFLVLDNGDEVAASAAYCEVAVSALSRRIECPQCKQLVEVIPTPSEGVAGVTPFVSAMSLLCGDNHVIDCPHCEKVFVIRVQAWFEYV